jgi:GT2 family glycosyltransferase
MNRFWETIIEPALKIAQPRVIVEVGAETGKTTEKLLKFCIDHDAILHSIDPNPKFEVAAWRSRYGSRFVFHEERSLEALGKVEPADAVLVDGDHNWYTVYHELRLLDDVARSHGNAFPLVFLHDVGWPYGRRDLYYNPDDIPSEYRQPFLRQGIRPGVSDLNETGGFNAHLFHATREGGPRNGVLTAVEDFLELREKPDALGYMQIPALQGLGVILLDSTSVGDSLRDLVKRLSIDPVSVPFIEAIERDRIGLQVRSAELAQQNEAERSRGSEQARLLTVAEQAANESNFRVREIEKQLRANERARREGEKHWRETLSSLQTAIDEVREQRELLQRELAAERDLLRAELTREREQFQTEVESRRKAREQEEAAQLSQLQDAVGKVLLREEAYLDNLRKAEERLGRIDILLAGLVGRTSTKKGTKRLGLARRELRAARRDLTDRSMDERSSSRATMFPTAASRRFLPGRVRPGSQQDEGTDDSTASDSGVRALVDIVVCVHNALDDVQRCFASLVRHTGGSYQVIVVDDGSDPECAAYLQEFTRHHPRFSLFRNDAPLGYTRAANLGLQLSTAAFVVLLNSDTVVSEQWLERLRECAESDSAIGIVGPLSNAASYQSVPELADANGDWSQNPLPLDWSIDQVAAALAEVSERAFPRVPFVNGFCFAITRAVIEAIGYFDEAAFPDGYGEENDYCLRAARAGFALAIADHAYVYHAKSRSYSHERRRELGKLGRSALLRKHQRERVEAGERALRDDPDLARARQTLEHRLQVQGVPPEINPLSVLFLLPVGGGGGGAHSIVQEASGMRRLGINAQIAVKSRHLPHYRNTYPSLTEAEDLFFGFGDEDELADHAARFSVVVATIHTSVPLLAAIAEANSWVVPAYYIQDYEPFFYAEGSPEREQAARSYTAIPDALLFAKTQWLCDTVSALHGVPVHKVSPSLDHDVYFPAPGERERKRVRVAAMIRPRSRRRGAQRTMEVLQRLSEEFAKGIDVHIFGCMDADIKASGLPQAFRYKNHGILKREEVAEVLRKSDVFLDLSDYQAFGRTGLEAMACGCAVVVPARGGSGEYAIHRENALVVDTSCLDECYEAARELVDNLQLREQLRQAGRAKAGDFSIDLAARSEVDLFQGVLNRKSEIKAWPELPFVHV